MAKVSQMQGVQAHLETLKKKDKQRHQARCIFFIKGSKICDCPQNLNYYTHRCGGSSRCDFYEERDADN